MAAEPVSSAERQQRQTAQARAQAIYSSARGPASRSEAAHDADDHRRPRRRPQHPANNYGDPLSKLGIPSNGIGSGGGIGSGSGGGVGSGKGAGVGPGSGGGFGGGAYRIGGGVSAPSVLSKVEPEYSEEARKAKWQGTVVLSLVVDDQGRPQNLKVLRSLGLGLDQKAIEAVEKWRFKPGMKDGKPVPVMATIEVNFRLL